MSARYPLVRNSYAFATRRGVFTSPARSGSSPISASSFLINSCICLLYISSFAAPCHAAPRRGHDRAQVAGSHPDALYAERSNVESARRAADIWAAVVEQNSKSPSAFVAAWKLSRACYWLGGHAGEAAPRRVVAS